MKEQKNKNQKVIIGGLISTLLLVVFITLRCFDFKGLELDIKWIVVCGIPVFVSIFISGFVKSFKGFGVELEANLTEPINLEFVKAIETIETYGFQKSHLDFLNRLTANEKRKAQKLSFILGKEKYYDSYAVEEYFRQLPNLQFIEITSETGILKYLIDARQFIGREGVERFPKHDKIIALIEAIERDEVLIKFSGVITKRIKRTDSIIDAYKEFESTSQGRLSIYKNQLLPVVDNSERMIGVIDRRSLEESISKEVLKAIEK